MIRAILAFSLCFCVCACFSQDDDLSRRSYLMINSKRQLLGLPALAFRNNDRPNEELQLVMSGIDFERISPCKDDCQWSVLITGKSMKEYHRNLTDLKWPYFQDNKKQITIASAIDPRNGSYWSVIYVY